MNRQDDIRDWINRNLAVMGRGSKKKLADFLGLPPLQITRMLNTDSGKETRAIRADEFEKIKIFFGETSFILSRDITAAKRKKLIAILEHSSPEQQEALLAFLEIWGKKRQK